MAEGAAPAAAAVDDPARPAAGNSKDGGSAGPDTPPRQQQQQRRGIVSRLWKGLFRPSDDFEKLLQLLSKEEAAVQARLKRRAISSQKTARRVIAVSVIVEVVAVVYAVMKTRESDLNWQLRAVHVLPMFLLPVLSALMYSALVSFTRMFDSKDKKTLERLRAERQAKIDELKERTNYYTTQQLIQKYDLDPTAKAAAATVLATKLGSDSGLKVYVGDESGINASAGKSDDVELVPSTGLRNRKHSHARGGNPGSFSSSQFIDETPATYAVDTPGDSSPSQGVIEHYKSSDPNYGSWLARIAALLVGEDPTQCYALICSNCFMHNGLARKEDFSYITYYCPHCHALNGSKHPEEHEVGLISGKDTPTSSVESIVEDESNTSSFPRTAAGTSLSAVQEHDQENEKELDEVAS